MTEKQIKLPENLRMAAGGLCLLVAPLVSFVLFEYVTGNLTQIPFLMAALNFGWYLAVYLLLFIITGNTRLAVPAGALIFYVISLAETFVVAFRDRPIMIWDVMALGTAMTVAGNYRFTVTPAMILAGIGVLLLAAAAILLPLRIRKKKIRLAAVLGGITAIFLYGLCFFSRIVPGLDLEINMWEFNESYSEYGYILSTAVSFRYIVKKKPEGYSASAVRKIREDMQAEGAEEVQEEDGDAIQPVNLICIMNESLSELKTGGDFETNQEYFPFLNSLTENTSRGSLCVPVFGSMTSNTEYEFLTGNSMSQLPSNCIAYQFLVRNNTPSLVSTLKSQGYRAVAMHPYPGNNWNRTECYKNMGFDEFMDESAYEGCEQLRNYVSDQADYEKIIEVVEAKENPEDRLFVFNVTMQNHGGYENQHENFTQEVWLTGDLKGKYPKTDQYLSLMKKSDEALEYLISYFEDSDEPTMIVMFGDHQPSVEDEFFDEIAGRPSTEVPVGEKIMWYETPYLIWTNYDTEEEDNGRLGAIYLSSEVLERAGLEMTPYNRFLLEMKEELPVVHPFGCYDGDGNFYTWTEIADTDSPFRERIMEYEYLVYNQLYDPDMEKEMFFLSASP